MPDAELHTSRTLASLGVKIEPTRRMRGEGMSWDHEILVALPPSYEWSNRSYPVLWVMDGSSQFDLAVQIVNYYSTNQFGTRLVPEMIVVGVGAPPDAFRESQERRAFDFSSAQSRLFESLGSELLQEQIEIYDRQLNADGKAVPKRLGGAPLFLAFLVDAVRPVLAQEYRIANDHTLWGHSGGGHFCAYALFARTKAFTRYICGSPNLYDGSFSLFEREKEYASLHKDMPAKVFFGAGEREMLEGWLVSAYGCVSSMARMAEILALRSYPSLKLHARIFPGEDHLSVIPLNLSWGLRAVWEGDVEAVERAAQRRRTA